MREIRLSGSEGGGVEPNRPSLPLSWPRRIEFLEQKMTGPCSGTIDPASAGEAIRAGRLECPFGRSIRSDGL